MRRRKSTPKLTRVAIYCHHKPSKEKEEAAFLKQLLPFLKENGVEVIHGDLRCNELTDSVVPVLDDTKPYHLKIAIGGDGTLLKLIRTLHKKDGYLIGINFGTLGFLSELQPDNAFSGLQQIFDGDFFIDERMLLKAFVWRKNESGKREKVFRPYGLNEIVFGHGGLARITNFNVKVNRRRLSIYRGDGLIFSTPTGSTAYSLSAGGPIIYPQVDSIVVNPVAPHSLSHRPIILPHDSLIHVKFDSRASSISMTIDGQLHFSLLPKDEVSLMRATRTAKFIRLKQSHYFKTLRNKMGWGEKK
jgi:NAD+ kinase